MNKKVCPDRSGTDHSIVNGKLSSWNDNVKNNIIDNAINQETDQIHNVESTVSTDVLLHPQHQGQQFDFIHFVEMPMFTLDKNGSIIGWNNKMREVTGVSVDEALTEQCTFRLEGDYYDSDEFEQKMLVISIPLAMHESISVVSGWKILYDVFSSGEACTCDCTLHVRRGTMEQAACSQISINVKVVACTSVVPGIEELSGFLCVAETTKSTSVPNQRQEGVRWNDLHLMDTDQIESFNDCLHTEKTMSSTDSLGFPYLVVDEFCNVLQWNTELYELTGYSIEDARSDFNKNSPGPLHCNDLFHSILDIFRTCMQAQILLEAVSNNYAELLIRHNIDASSICISIRVGKQVSSVEADPQYQFIVCVQDVTEIKTGYNSPNHIIQPVMYHDKLLKNQENEIDPFVSKFNNQGKIELWNDIVSSLLTQDNVHPIDSLNMNRNATVLQNESLDGTETKRSELGMILNIASSNVKSIDDFVDSFQKLCESSRDLMHSIVITSKDTTNRAYLQSNIKERLRCYIDTAGSPVFGINRYGLVTEWNDKTADTLGFSADEVIGKSFVKTFIASHLQSSIDAIIEAGLAGCGTSNFEMEVQTKTRDVLYWLVTVTPIMRLNRDYNDTTLFDLVLFTAQDITEPSKHERAISSMVSELRQLIDSANTPIFGIDGDGDVNEWNDKIAEITGYTKEEVYDCPLVETFIAPYLQASVQGVLENALEGRGTSNFELEFRTKSNEIRHFLVNVTTRRDAENNVAGVFCVAQDVTEAVQRDRAVAGMALELRQLIDTANAPIFGIDIDGNVNEWNRCAQEITGYSKEDTFDEPLVDSFIASSMRQKVHEILNAALQGNETSNYELEFITRSGESRFMRVNAATRRDPECNVVGVVGVAQDVTEDKKHAAELQKLHYIQATQEAKVETERNMTAYFAHELRNPLSAIDSALNSMPDNLPDSAKTLIQGMQLCSGFMSSIMNNLLDVRKMEEGKMTLKVSVISLNALISRVHTMLKPSVKPGVTFCMDFQTQDRDWVLGDEHRIQQILTNVVTNAIKYTLTGSITLRIGWDGDLVKFQCIDTGPGIPKSEQEKLFQRFVQRGGAPGTGLGLVIAKHLVDLTGGTIRFDSDPSVKIGTTCIVMMRLPISQSSEAEPDVDESIPMIERKLNFLIIDDVKMNRMMLKRRIQKNICQNCTIEEASTGEEALDICKTKQFDVIIVDHYMEEAGGVMVGTDVVYAMRRMKIDSIIIGCSGNDLVEEFSQAGADWVWQKPMPSNGKIISHLQAGLKRKTTRFI